MLLDFCALILNIKKEYVLLVLKYVTIENCAHYGKNKPYQEVENDNNFCKKPDVCLSPETEILDTVGKKTI